VYGWARTAAVPPLGFSVGFVSALLAIFRAKQSLLLATIRWQASSYREEAGLVFVGASLLAIFRAKQTLLLATIRWQASSYREEAGIVFVGAWLLAIFRAKRTLFNATIRWQASSYKNRSPGQRFKLLEGFERY
jgi:hypothetical protein